MPSRMMTTSLPVLDHALGPLDRELGHHRVLVGRAVEGRRDDLALHPAAHVGDLFGPLVDEQHDEVDLGVVRLDRPGDLLHDRGLAGLRRRHDQAALALADRRDQVDDPRRHVARVVGDLEAQLLVREQRREVLELRTRARLLGIDAVHRVDAQQRGVLLVAAGRTAGALQVVALAQTELPRLLHRHVDVVLAREVALACAGSRSPRRVGRADPRRRSAPRPTAPLRARCPDGRHPDGRRHLDGRFRPDARCRPGGHRRLRRHLGGHDLGRAHGAGAGGCPAHLGLVRRRHLDGRCRPDGRCPDARCRPDDRCPPDDRCRLGGHGHGSPASPRWTCRRSPMPRPRPEHHRPARAPIPPSAHPRASHRSPQVQPRPRARQPCGSATRAWREPRPARSTRTRLRSARGCGRRSRPSSCESWP